MRFRQGDILARIDPDLLFVGEEVAARCPNLQGNHLPGAVVDPHHHTLLLSHCSSFQPIPRLPFQAARISPSCSLTTVTLPRTVGMIFSGNGNHASAVVVISYRTFACWS